MKREDIAALSPHERAEVARWLAELRPRLPSHVIPRLRRRRRLMLGTITAATVVLALNMLLLLQTAGIPVSFLGSN